MIARAERAEAEVQRLRGEPHPPNMASAADLFAENERLRARITLAEGSLWRIADYVDRHWRAKIKDEQTLADENGKWLFESIVEQTNSLSSQLDKAEAENERLRAAMSAAKEHAGDATKALLAEVALWKGRAERADAALATAEAAGMERAAQTIEPFEAHFLHMYSRGPNSPPGNRWEMMDGKAAASIIRSAIAARHDAATGRGG